MSYEPRPGTTDRGGDVIVNPQGPNYGGIAVATVLIVVAILFALWYFSNEGDGAGTDATTPPPTETSAPVETTLPAETTTTPTP